MKRRVRWLLAAVLTLLLMVGVGRVLWLRCGLRGCPSIERLDRYVPDNASRVLDRNGVELARLYSVHREIVPLHSLPEYVPQAFIAIEDQRFRQHHGIDWRRALGAAWANLRSLGIEQGFSTITMQLARNAFPDRLPYTDRTIGRKLAEMRVATLIEERYTKDQILGLYLNHVYFGSGAWGIAAAAHEYFRKPASSLTLAEAALLAGMVTAPNGLNPRTHPDLAYKRRWVVLHVMWRQGLITEQEANEASDAPLITAEGTARPAHLAPYFVQEVRHFMEREIGEAIYTEGYTIHTTLDAGVQGVAEAELRAELAAVEARAGARAGAGERPGGAGDGKSGREPLQGAVIVMDAPTGDVLAMVGGRDFSKSRFNRALRARRQAASTFKPFVYAAALANGYTPAHRLDDTPIRREMGGGRVWAPRNYEGRYAEAISLRDALVVSSNVATIRLAEAVGLDRVAEVARRMGLRGPFPLVPALALGTVDVTLIELTAAYAAFATLGRRPEPRIVTRVVNGEGRVVWRREPRVTEVLDPGIAFLMTDIMRDVVERGTATAVRDAGFRGPAAGKTGTSNDATDYWFIGFTPSRVAGIWIGYDLPRPILPGIAADAVAPGLWGRIMRRTVPVGEPEWQPPSMVEMRRVDGAGGVYGPDCTLDGLAEDSIRTEYFLATTAPRGPCGAPIPPPALADSGGVRPDSLAIPASDRPGGPRSP
ncbi:MAG TPA: PBP1A family penicillin-binding protein [Longimicrobiales bacterium]